MERKWGYRGALLGVVVLLMASTSALAKNSRTVKIGHDATLNGTMVPAGFYEVSWQTHSPEATVTVSDSKRVVVSTNGRWDTRNVRYEANAVVYDTKDDGSRTIIEIRFEGLKGALVFGPSTQ